MVLILALISLSPSGMAQEGRPQPLVLAGHEANQLEPIADPVVTADACGKVCGGESAGGWMARANLVVLQRTSPDSLVLIQDQSDPSQTLNATDFHFDYELGWDVSLIGHVAGLPETEVRFFSVDGWTAQAAASMFTAPIEIPMAIPESVDATGIVTASCGSELHSFETNVRLPYSDCLTLLAGFRYLELDEQFHADIPSGVTLDLATRNRLYGAQAGAEAQLWQLGNWSLEGMAKVGLFGNAAAQDGVLNTGLVAVENGASAGTAAVLIETGLAAVYQVTPRLAVRGAYNVLWLDNVALATDQIPATNFVTDAGIDQHGDVFYHGAFVGIEYRR